MDRAEFATVISRALGKATGHDTPSPELLAAFMSAIDADPVEIYVLTPAELALQIEDGYHSWRGLSHGVACPNCNGAGRTCYGSTATWRGGMGGQAVTWGVCDKCWGSGDKFRPWPSHRVFEAMQQAARGKSLRVAPLPPADIDGVMLKALKRVIGDDRQHDGGLRAELLAEGVELVSREELALLRAGVSPDGGTAQWP
jgi:hypothetical protein